jgi:hypothetical protein
MKTMRTIFLIISGFYINSAICQSIVKNDLKYIVFHVQEAYNNGIDISQNAIYQKQYLLYEIFDNPEENMFYNVWVTNQSYSFGDAINSEFSEKYTEDGDLVFILKFVWNYKNSYNNNSGFGDVDIHIMFKNENYGIFMVEIQTERELLVYFGEVELK